MEKKIYAILVNLFLIVILFLPSLAQETQKEQQQMMESYMKMMALNENHAFLKYFAGE
jgi:preprotein translocase subunit SecG